MSAPRRGRTAILAAGDFPRRGGAAWRALESAARVVCCDGAADAYRRRFGREPAAVVGDCDSLKGRFQNVCRDPSQDDCDLAKAHRYCVSRGWRRPVVLGATGKREDHTVANIFLALDLGLEVVTDFGRFVPVEGEASFRVAKGTAISVFAPDRRTKASSEGLEWPLDGVVFDSLHRASSNRASSSRVRIRSDRRVAVYFAA